MVLEEDVEHNQDPLVVLVVLEVNGECLEGKQLTQEIRVEQDQQFLVLVTP